MFAWADIILAALKLISAIINWAHDNGLIEQGRQQEIAAVAAQIADKVKVRDQIKDEVDAMDESQVDKSLAGLVDPPAGKS